MATPRKPFARIESSLFRESWPADVKLAYVMLTLWLTDRWARDRLTAKEACRATLSRSALYAITGKHRTDVAATLLQRLADVAAMSIQRRGDVTEMFWPKFAELQGLESRAGEISGPGLPQSAHAPAHAPDKRRKDAPTARPAAPKRPPAEPGKEASKEDDLTWLVPILEASGSRTAAKLSRWKHLGEGEAAEWLESKADYLQAEAEAKVESSGGTLHARLKPHAIAAFNVYLRGDRPFRLRRLFDRVNAEDAEDRKNYVQPTVEVPESWLSQRSN